MKDGHGGMGRRANTERLLCTAPRRSQGIGKGQVSGFVNFMRSDLDLATKTQCMEAIRLTEGKDSRLLRFVKSGGVTKIARVPGHSILVLGILCLVNIDTVIVVVVVIAIIVMMSNISILTMLVLLLLIKITANVVLITVCIRIRIIIIGPKP